MTGKFYEIVREGDGDPYVKLQVDLDWQDFEMRALGAGMVEIKFSVPEERL